VVVVVSLLAVVVDVVVVAISVNISSVVVVVASHSLPRARHIAISDNNFNKGIFL